jgi:pimeloyl-ACP methyl ester carboxylesterase
MSEPALARADVNGIAMAFRWWPGPDESRHPPAVVLHGVLQTGDGLRHLAQWLSRGGGVLVPDLRGRGATEAPDTGYDPVTMADDVAALIGHVGCDRPVLIGRMHGGVIAYHLAARRPDLARGVVLSEANPEISEERAERRLDAIRTLPRQFDSRQEAERFYEDRLLLPPARAQHDIPIDLETTSDGHLRWRHNLDIVSRIEAAATPRADWDVLARVPVPLLILRGQRGELPPDTAQRARAEAPRARVLTIYGAGREVFLGPGSEQALAAIELFLTGLKDGR